MSDFRILACITEQHDLRLVALAGIICLFTTYTTFSLLARATIASGIRSGWLAAAATALGSGVWSTHFVAMLAYQTDAPVAYELYRTALSIVIGIVGGGAGLALALRDARLRLAGGALVGLSVAGLHYVGMSAMTFAGHLEYDVGGVRDSVLIGTGLAMPALWVGLARRSFGARAAGAALLALAICGLHFTGMNATSPVFDGSALQRTTAAPGLMAVAIAAISVLILALSLAGALFDEHLAGRAANEAARLRESEARFRQLANATFEGLFIHVEGRVLDANRTLCRLLGYDLDQLIGRSMFDHMTGASRQQAQQRLIAPSAAPLELEIVTAEGAVVPVEALAQDIVYNGGAARVVAIRDLRERRKAERDIQYLAHHDPLTGLANRILFNDRLAQAIGLARREPDRQVAVLCIDLDRFKQLNDLHGYRSGDALLRELSGRLRRCLRAHDTVARFGDDEFTVIQNNAQPDDVLHVVERVRAAIEAPFDCEGQQLRTSASIGIALFPADGDDAETLLRAAYAALHRAKENGRNGYRFFEPVLDTRLHERSRLESDLRHAIEHAQLQLYYQPLFDCTSGAVLGCEALLRWQHPERGFISPADFIPIAEESGLIVPLSRWVLTTACHDAARWPAQLGVAVNLSPTQFRQISLQGDVLATLTQSGLAPHRLELEITEGVLMENTGQTLDTLRALKSAGIRIALDDFGTGFSSLSYLQRFPFDKLKIDRSFVWGMETSQDSMAIVRAIIALGHSLRISVTAEGVETAAQLDILRAENCDSIQGFLLGRPQPLAELEALLGIAPPAESRAG